MSNYPPGVNDNDPHFDLPSAGDEDGLCSLCGHSGSVRNGVCLDGYEPPDMNPGCACHCTFPSAPEAQSAGERIAEQWFRKRKLTPKFIAELSSMIDSAVSKAQTHTWATAVHIAGQWAASHSCDSHDYNPCCHVRTGASIKDALKTAARQQAAQGVK